MGRTSSQLAGILLVVGFLVALHTVGLRAATLGPAFAALVIAALATGPLRLSRGPIDLLILLFSSWVILVTVPHLGIWESSFQLTAFLLLPLAFLALRGMQETDIDRLLDALVLILACLGAVAILYAIGGDRQSPIFPNRNNQAALLNMGAMLAAGLAVGRYRDDTSWRWLVPATVVLVAGAVLAGSRGALLGLGAGLVVSVIVARNQIKRWFMFVALPVASGWVIAALVGAGWVAQRAATLANPELASNMRIGQWSTALELATTAPIFGHGLGLNHWVWAASRLTDRSRGVYTHNDYIQIAVETGFPGALLLVALLGAVLWVAVRHGPFSSRQGAVVGAVGAVTAVAVHAVVSYHLQLAPFLLLIGMMAAVVARAGPSTGLLQERIVWARGVVVALLLLHAGLLTAYGVVMPTHRTAYLLASQSKLEFTQAPDDTIVNRLQLATRLQPHATEALLALASASWSTCRERGTTIDCDRARQLADTAVRRNPHSYEAIYLRGKYAADMVDLLRAIEMNPRFTAARMEAAAGFELRGNREDALSVLAHGLYRIGWPQQSDRTYLDRTEELARSMGRDDIVATVAQVRGRIGRRLD